ncbi:MAG: hypothetical protein ACT4OZ_17055 [Gemmatimonadota bacterium]
MRKTAVVSGLLFALACGGGETPAADSSAAAPMTPTLSLADLAGTWTQTVTTEGSDSVLVTSTLTGTADASSWTITLPGRQPMPVQIMVAGDSIMTSSGPYESVLRPGVQVTTNGVARLVNGEMVGTTIARYVTANADSVVRLRNVARRNP